MKKLATPLAAALAALGALSCGDTTNTPLSQLILNGPTDIAFSCWGMMRVTEGAGATKEQEIVFTSMPATACALRSQIEETRASGQENLEGQTNMTINWYGLALQSGPGTVAVIQFPEGHASTLADGGFVVDLGETTPGTNSVAVGENPVAIATERDGCYALTANAGTCDLSVLNINSVVDSDPSTDLRRLDVTNAMGARIAAKPSAMLAEPANGVVGFECKAQPAGLVYIAYPGCHLVAAVDASTGRMVAGIQYDAAGVPTIVDGNVTCTNECGGALPTPGVRPIALDLVDDPRTGERKLAIGLENHSQLTVVELDAASLPLNVFTVGLEDPKGTLGVTQLAISPVIGMGGFRSGIDDEGPGGEFQFIYAVASDGTVRVADVLNLRRECETQADPRFTRKLSLARDYACMQIGAPATPRRAGVTSPGIALPSKAIPLSVSIVRSADCPPGSDDATCRRSPGVLVGYFATISSSTGEVFIANIDDDAYPDVFRANAPFDAVPTYAAAHTLRDATGARHHVIDDDIDPMGPNGGPIATQRSCTYSGPPDSSTTVANGGARITTNPLRNYIEGTIAPEKLTELPYIRQLHCARDVGDGTEGGATERSELAVSELSFAAPPEQRDLAFPDLGALFSAETWAIVWEGPLSADSVSSDVDGPAVREGMMTVDSAGIHLHDKTKAFCDAGVEPNDIVQLRGCEPSLGNVDCPSGYTCFVHPESRIPGLGACMLEDEAERLANACKDFLTTFRRYTVKSSTTGELIATPRRFELRTTPLDGCTDDAQCKQLANYAATFPSATVDNNSNTDTFSWGCVVDPNRAPLGGTGKRCQMQCNVTSQCAVGTVCSGGSGDADPAALKTGFCMEGVTPPQACVNASQRYELRVGEAFAVLGARSGFVHPVIAGANDVCVRDEMASPLMTSRIPLQPHDRAAPSTLHVCDPTADPMTGRLPNGTFEPNPCSTTVAQTDVVPNYRPDSCELDPDAPATRLVDRAAAPAVKFRNRGMTINIVDPYYGGDARCPADRAGTLAGKIPHVVPGYSMTFRQTAGLNPLLVPIRPTLPTRVVRGPGESTWIIDTGDFLSSTPGVASTRGRIFYVDRVRLINAFQ